MKEKFIKAFMRIAEIFSELSSAERLKVGCVIVNDSGRILSVGYNGMPTGWDNCCETEITEEQINDYRGEMVKNQVTKFVTKSEVLHAEANAILKCAKDGESTKGATLFTTHAPCMECSKLIYQSGIKNLYYKYSYRNLDGLDFLRKCKTVGIVKLNEEDNSLMS